MEFLTKSVVWLQKKFAPPEDKSSPVGNTNGRTIAFMIGFVAFMLPIILYASTYFGNCHYDSISHFYYSRFTGDIFVGALFFVGAVMLAYESEAKNETNLARIAGICAFGVALFPTSDSGCEGKVGLLGRAFSKVDTNAIGGVTGGGLDKEAFQLFPSVETVHLSFAVVLFAILIIFCFFVFTNAFPDQRQSDGSFTAQKKLRNKIYVCSGSAMLVAALSIIVAPKIVTETHWNEINGMFWAESVMLLGFGLSWMVKGRFRILLWIPLLGWAFRSIAPLIDEHAARERSSST